MTREEAKKLVKPLVWQEKVDGYVGFVSFMDLPNAKQIKITAAKCGSSHFVTVNFKGKDMLWECWVPGISKAKEIAEEWYTSFVLGFLNLEGGETRRCTEMKDRHGNYAYEGDRIRFWDVSYFDSIIERDAFGDPYPEYVDGELSSYEGIVVFEHGCFHVKNSDHLYQDASLCDNPDDRLLPLFWLPHSTLEYVSQTARERGWDEMENEWNVPLEYPEWICRTYGITAEELAIRLSTFEIIEKGGPQ